MSAQAWETHSGARGDSEKTLLKISLRLFHKLMLRRHAIIWRLILLTFEILVCDELSMSDARIALSLFHRSCYKNSRTEDDSQKIGALGRTL
jgi:hypothetical protein